MRLFLCEKLQGLNKSFSWISAWWNMWSIFQAASALKITFCVIWRWWILQGCSVLPIPLLLLIKTLGSLALTTQNIYLESLKLIIVIPISPQKCLHTWENITICLPVSGCVMRYERWAESREERRPASHHLVIHGGRQSAGRLSARLISIPLAHWVIEISNWVL